MFSSRFPPLEPTRLGRALARARASGRRLLDLTESNPTAAGLACAPDMLDALADPGGCRYEPAARGLALARAAIAAEYASRGGTAAADRVVLTAGTSEAYGLLFKLLCDPGDEVLIPTPSYPLFDLLTRFDAVVPRPYGLDRDRAWRIDLDAVERALGPATRAILVVSPNNPTGSIVTREERDWLAALCAARGLAIIADEVFVDYPLAPGPHAVSLAGESRALTFTLGGLSKSVGLPQVKLAWMLASGPDALVTGALERLELIADTYLTVSTAAQLAAPALLAGGRELRDRIRERLRRNLAALDRAVGACPAATMAAPEGGWSAVIRVPQVDADDALALRLLEDADVVVHPGYFYDFEAGAFVVVSLLCDPDAFDEGVSRLLAAVEAGS